MALEKPFVHSITAEGDPDPVNFNDAFTFRKDTEKTYTSGSSSPKYFIVFSRDENSAAPKEITWKYLNECDRNNEYTKLLELISKPIQ